MFSFGRKKAPAAPRHTKDILNDFVEKVQELEARAKDLDVRVKSQEQVIERAKHEKDLAERESAWARDAASRIGTNFLGWCGTIEPETV